MQAYKVLLVEDQPIALKVAQLTLKQANCLVDIATTGAEALQCVQSSTYDIIFMDLGLPDGDGLSTALTIRKYYRNNYVPIVILTAHSDLETKTNCLQAGMDEFIVKPLSLEVCRQLLQKYCKQYEALSAMNKIRVNFNVRDGNKDLNNRSWELFYLHKEGTIQTIDEIFKENPYQFKVNNIKPFIIDCGSNIGLATIYFKILYPEAEIVCFEPDPNAYFVLDKNMKVNNLKNVSLINAAVGAADSVINFYGQVHPDNPDTRGNSIIELWGKQRQEDQSVPVKCVKLSSYINKEVDFLKLDIEGAEQQVLCELADKLSLIKEMSIEYHHSDKMQDVNNLDSIIRLLTKYHFDYEIVKKDIRELLPAIIQPWVNKVNPYLCQIKAIRK